MKTITITLKSPDCVFDALEEAGISASDSTKIPKWVSKWVEYGEYVTIEVRSDGTASVVPV